MIKHIIVTDRPQMIPSLKDAMVMLPTAFIRGDEGLGLKGQKKSKAKIINLCSHYDYLSKGYYVSLLAEARGMHCIPHVSNIVKLNWKRNYEYALPELNDILKKSFNEPAEEPLARTYTTYFGRHRNEKLEPLTRRLFDMFRFPALTFDIKYVSAKGQWVVDRIDTVPIPPAGDVRLEHFQEALNAFTGSAWRTAEKNKKPEKYWIAILHNPDEEMPPSNKAALNKFIKIGKKMGLWVELITKQDFATLLEFDALFIRETTAINNHTFRFASKAEQEDIPCIDDTRSIVRCCNKVFLHELLQAHKIPGPRTRIIDRQQKWSALEIDKFPVVLKIPDGSFSRGVHKAENLEQLEKIAVDLLKKSEIILCQDFIETAFDWRIGILNGEPIFADQYYMATGHWQIYNHAAKKKAEQSGSDRSISIDQVPSEVLDVALKAANLIGNGLYGVDLKQTASGDVYVIEVNDNPNIDSGVEDSIEGDVLYEKILGYLVKLIES